MIGFIMTAPDGTTQTETADGYVFDMAALTHGQSTATFKVKGIVPGDDGSGNPRTWSIGSTTVYIDYGHITVTGEPLDDGGETYIPVHMDSSGLPCAGDTLSVENLDSLIIQPLQDSVNTRRQWQRQYSSEGTHELDGWRRI